MSYATEKLGLAIYELTVGEQDIKGRLESILKYLTPLSESDFPEDLRESWKNIMSKLTKKASNVAGTKYDEGQFLASLHGMRKITAVSIAKDIVHLSDSLQAYIDDGKWS